jgi:hypothetical protein
MLIGKGAEAGIRAYLSGRERKMTQVHNFTQIKIEI